MGAARTCSSTTRRSRWRGSAASPRVRRSRRQRTSGRPKREVSEQFRDRPVRPRRAFSLEASIHRAVPQEVQPEAGGPELIVREPRAVRHLVVAEVDLGAECKAPADAHVVRDPGDDCRRGSRAVVAQAVVVERDAAQPEAEVQVEPVPQGIADQNRLAAERDQPVGQLGAPRVERLVRAEVAEQLEAVGETVAHAEAEVERAGPEVVWIREADRSAADPEAEEKSLSRIAPGRRGIVAALLQRPRRTARGGTIVGARRDRGRKHEREGEDRGATHDRKTLQAARWPPGGIIRRTPPGASRETFFDTNESDVHARREREASEAPTPAPPASCPQPAATSWPPE